MADERDRVRFYFSFRSPYAWLAMVRIEPALAGEPVTLDYHPVFPPGKFPNDPAAVPDKLRYIERDIQRMARAYGLDPRPTVAVDTDWMPPHAAFIYAQDQGLGRPYALALFSKRFEQQQDVGDAAVIAEAAREVGLDAAATVAASATEDYQTRVMQGMIQATREDALFGVPFFVYRGEPFWGNDRIHWLKRAIRLSHGRPVVDLREDALRPLDR